MEYVISLQLSLINISLVIKKTIFLRYFFGNLSYFLKLIYGIINLENQCLYKICWMNWTLSKKKP